MSLSVEEGKAIVTEFCAEYPSAYQVQYKLRNTQEEVFNEKATIEEVGKIYGAYFPARNIAAFAVANFRDQDQLKGTLRHEILGHFGLNTCSDEEKHAILNSITASKDQPGISDLWQKIQKHYPKSPTSQIAEEVFAFACEEVSSKSLVSSDEGRLLFNACTKNPVLLERSDLSKLTHFIAGGLQDGSRQRQIFPSSDNEQFKKETKMEKKKPFHEAVAEKLIEQLKAGTAPWQRPWEPGNSLPTNPTTGNRYRGINSIQLMSQNREDNRWLTYKQASSLGAQVRKGEKGTPVQYWKFSEEQTKLDDDGKPVIGEDGKPVKVQVKLERPRTFMATVFNAEQIDGMPPLEKKEVTWDAHERAENILKFSGANISHNDSNRAFYRPSTDSIHLPEKNQFDSGDKYYATALHELGHWTGHSSRLDRDLANPFGSEAYAKEELRAEISSMIIGEELGIGHDTEQHASYVGSWIKVLEEDSLEIFRAAADAEKIHDYIFTLENQQKLENAKDEYQGQALEYLSHNYSLNSLSDEHKAFLNNTAEEGSAALVGAMELADKYSLKLNDEGFTFSVINTLNTYKNEATKDQGLTFLDSGFDKEKNLHKYLFQAKGGEHKHLVGIDFHANTAELLETISKNDRHNVEPDQDQFIDDVLSLPKTTLSNTRLDEKVEKYDRNPQVTELLNIDITEVLNNLDVTFDHYELFQGDTLESALRDHGFNTIGSVTGNQPGSFSDAAWESLSPVFGISPYHETPDNAYLERKGLAQQFAIQAEDIYQAHKESLTNETEVPAMAYRAGSDLNPNNIEVKPIDGSPDQYQVFSSDGEALSVAFSNKGEAMTEKARLTAEDRFVSGFKAGHLDDWLDSDSNQAFGFEVPHQWNGVVELRGNVTRENDQGNFDVFPASQFGVEPEFYSLYAQLDDGTHDLLEDYDQFNQAAQVKDRLSLAGANIEENELEREVMISRVHEDIVRRDPNSTDEDVLAAKESRKSAEMAAMLNDDDLQKSIREDELSASNTNQEATQHTYINVPYNEKNEAKSLGAKWDKKEQSWYIPTNVDSAQFSKWSEKPKTTLEKIDDSNKKYAQKAKEAIDNGGSVVDVMEESLADLKNIIADNKASLPNKQQGEKSYIQVPYKEKDEAKSLGAKWDRQEQSWYVPANADLANFSKWAVKPETNTQQRINDSNKKYAQKAKEAIDNGGDIIAVMEESVSDLKNIAKSKAKTFLAVPFGERELAKASGALWDKTAKSWYVGPNADAEKLNRWLPDNVPSQQTPAATPADEFSDALRSMGCVVTGEHPIMDGKKHRISAEGDKGSEKAGFYIGHLDGHPAGYIKNNRTGLEMKWKSKGYSLSDEEKAKLNAEAATKLAARAEVLQKTQNASAQRVNTQMSNLTPISASTPYLDSKGVKAHLGALTDAEGKTTMLPAQDAGGKIWTMQYINEDGTKRFAKDSKKEGCFHVVGGMDALAKAPALVVGEGYATAATGAEALGFATVAAFDSGNLPNVVSDLHQKFPDKPVIVIGDDDRHLEMTQGTNPGRTKAEAAAKAVGGKAVFPVFTPKESEYPSSLPAITPDAWRKKNVSDDQRTALDRIKKYTDFNDMAEKSELGMNGVKRQLNAAVSLSVKKVTSIAEQERQNKQEEVITKKRAARI